MLSNFRGYLLIRYLILGFNLNDVPLEILLLKPCLKFTLGFSRTKDLNGIGLTNIRNNLVIETVETVVKLPIARSLKRPIFGCIIGILHMFLYMGCDLSCFFAIVRDGYNNRFTMVNLHTDFAFSAFLLRLSTLFYSEPNLYPMVQEQKTSLSDGTYFLEIKISTLNFDRHHFHIRPIAFIKALESLNQLPPTGMSVI